VGGALQRVEGRFKEKSFELSFEFRIVVVIVVGLVIVDNHVETKISPSLSS